MSQQRPHDKYIRRGHLRWIRRAVIELTDWRSYVVPIIFLAFAAWLALYLGG